jgi:fatty acid desaturase
MNDPFDRAVLRERIERKQRQTRRVTACFRAHARVFVVVIAVMIGVWLVESAFDDDWGRPWFLPTLVGWGAALVLHGWIVHALTRRDAALQSRLDDAGGSA